ncbi:MAG: pyruvate dehydrogenase (acetyl-transferring) E1 component subunit alpha [Hadesarchaea archaeon YNP_N21]|nr:MAG: pyruvate dehydrogenase (acetyl-transferring) E1 component subunit alpha [Hadesarchaea archaeon YNP_N21]
MLSKEKMVEMYTTMVKIRLFEEKAHELYTAGKIPGFLHSSAGQEATEVGVIANLRPDDYLTSTHRPHGHLIARGGDVKRIMAELYGKSTGYCKGKGGDMHTTSFELGIVCATGIVGGGIPISLGPALASKLRGTDQVTVCFFGDGASNQGTFHESLNLASIWDLPVVFVCENNQYAISTPQREHQRIKDISMRAAAYGVPGLTVDGNDVLAVYKAANEAIKRARDGNGPTLLECKTFNYHRAKYEAVSKVLSTEFERELREWEKKDPIKVFESKLLEMKLLTREDMEKIHAQIMDELEEAARFAEASPWPRKEETLEDVFT